MTTKTIAIDDARKKFSELLKFTLQGNEVIIVEKDKQVARLIPISSSQKPRIPGLNQSKIWSTEDFDKPLSDEFWLGAE